MKLKRKKVGDRSYELVDTDTGKVIATAAQTGERGRDHYPWEWSLEEGMIFGKLDLNTGRSVENLKDAVDSVESGVNSFGLLTPVGPIDPNGILEGDVFRVLQGGRYHYYRATQDAYKGYRVEIPANHSSGELTEVHLTRNQHVTLYKTVMKGKQ